MNLTVLVIIVNNVRFPPLKIEYGVITYFIHIRNFCKGKITAQSVLLLKTSLRTPFCFKERQLFIAPSFVPVTHIPQTNRGNNRLEIGAGSLIINFTDVEYEQIMNELEFFPYYHPITVRFADLDPQGHVNNAVYLTYLESARLGYYEQAGIWGREAGMKTGMVVAHIDIDYLAPIFFGQDIQVGVRLARLGQKSFTLAFVIETVPEKVPLARGTSVMVAYDSTTGQSIPVPPDWREKLLYFEGGKES
jgi:acyl-CoA thioester hydrolase